MKKSLSERWIKASVTGTIWAASEIVLGSFLHNLKIPFSGNILTAIGIVILISISYIWTEKGIFWRAGVICAIMKTMSPSAVIFGPMIGIFAESVLLELSVRLLGRNVAGYAAGAMLAMSWNLFQKIASYIIYYGTNIVDLYSNLLKMAQKQLDIHTDIVWLPIIVLLALYALFGLLAAILGMRVGKKMLHQPAEPGTGMPEPAKGSFSKSPAPDFRYSVTWLLVNILLIIGSFFLLSYTPWYIWSTSITCIVIAWTIRYKRALRQLSKPRFWIFFVVITLLTAFVFTKTGKGENYLIEGLLTGIQMNFRAVLIIIGFATLGIELYNPVVRNFFLKTHFRNLPLALELSAESLPAFIAAIPDFKSLRKNPVSIFYRVISHAGIRFSEIIEKNAGKVFIISGARESGKTTFARDLAAVLREKHAAVFGFLSERIMEGTGTEGYNILDLSTGERVHFLTSEKIAGEEKIGKFYILPEGLEAGNKALHALSGKNRMIIIIDEVGRLELSGGGWAAGISGLLSSGSTIIMVVRNEFTDKVMEQFRLPGARVIDISTISASEAADIVLG